VDDYTDDELAEALQLINSTIIGCEKLQPKFAKGTSQHTLLENRIKALYISQTLITSQNAGKFTKQEMIAALPPLSSIITKSEKAQQRFAVGTYLHERLRKIINTMKISKSIIINEISKR